MEFWIAKFLKEKKITVNPAEQRKATFGPAFGILKFSLDTLILASSCKAHSCTLKDTRLLDTPSVPNYKLF
jgi:hypothetical protein